MVENLKIDRALDRSFIPPLSSPSRPTLPVIPFPGTIEFRVSSAHYECPVQGT